MMPTEDKPRVLILQFEGCNEEKFWRSWRAYERKKQITTVMLEGQNQCDVFWINPNTGEQLRVSRFGWKPTSHMDPGVQVDITLKDYGLTREGKQTARRLWFDFADYLRDHLQIHYRIGGAIAAWTDPFYREWSYEKREIWARGELEQWVALFERMSRDLHIWIPKIGLLVTEHDLSKESRAVHRRWFVGDSLGIPPIGEPPLGKGLIDAYKLPDERIKIVFELGDFFKPHLFWQFADKIFEEMELEGFAPQWLTTGDERGKKHVSIDTKLDALLAGQTATGEDLSCFISYSSKDQTFAERLYKDLQDARVRCWFAPENMKIGAKIRPTLDESIRGQDKLLLILSKHSIASQWVEQEVETALARERKEGRIILLPIRVDNAVMEIQSGWPALIRNTRHIGDFCHWENDNAYQKAFDRLLRDLKAEEGAEATT